MIHVNVATISWQDFIQSQEKYFRTESNYGKRFLSMQPRYHGKSLFNRKKNTLEQNQNLAKQFMFISNTCRNYSTRQAQKCMQTIPTKNVKMHYTKHTCKQLKHRYPIYRFGMHDLPNHSHAEMELKLHNKIPKA